MGCPPERGPLAESPLPCACHPHIVPAPVGVGSPVASDGPCLRRNGTSMISLILPPKDQISRAAKMLSDEFGTASNIKSRVNRLSVLSAITSTQQRLKLFNKVCMPPPTLCWRLGLGGGQAAMVRGRASLMVLSGAAEWSSHLLWHDPDRRQQREESEYRFRAFQAHQHVAVLVR